MAKQIVIDKLKEYKEYKKILQYKMKVAIDLRFKSEVAKLENDIRWCKEIIELINNIDSEKQYYLQRPLYGGVWNAMEYALYKLLCVVWIIND